MKRRGDEKDDEKDSSRIKLVRIHLDTRLPAKFLMKPHQKKDRSPSKVDPIPLDLELDIMTRLPAKSLMRFRCVSKMWSSIIRSQRFVDSYYAMSSAMRSRFTIAFSNGPSPRCKKRLFIFSSSYEEEKSSSLVTNLEMAIPSVGFSDGSNCASVHGLIGCGSLPFVVCNPSTKKVTTFPGIGPFTLLGYDPVHGQFKALNLLSCPYRYQDFKVHEVLTLGGGGAGESSSSSSSSWRRKKFATPYYYTATSAIPINGFVYHGAWTPNRSENPVIVCFDVRYERISFIKAPRAAVCWEGDSILIEYKGKLASISRHPYGPLDSFDLWILEDVKKHDWSKQTFKLPFSLGLGRVMTSPGTNKAGEIIFAPKYLSRHVQHFYIFYYNVERKDMRRVRLLGIADDEEFRRVNGFVNACRVYISPEHVETIASL